MAIQAQGGAGGAGFTQSGGNGGTADQNGVAASGGVGGAAGTPPGGDGERGNSGSNASVGGDGGGGGADGTSGNTVGGRGGDGGYGAVAGSDDGTGGGGGGGGGAGLGDGADLTVSGIIEGGDGGDGGNGASGGSVYGDGGSGGGGGDGLVMTASGHTITLAAGAIIVAGDGGYGGNTSVGDGSNGGDGGDGVFAYDGNTIVNAGSIRGGSGGSAGHGFFYGVGGAYGAGIVGSNLTVTNTGTIVGGFDNAATVHGNALTFTAGTNTLTLSSGGTAGTINGNIAVSGSLDISSGGVAASLGGYALVFGAAATAVTIESGVTVKDDVSGFVAGDTLDFRGVAYSAKLEAVFTTSATGGTLRIVDSTHQTNVVATVTLDGAYTSGVFGLANDGNGGTKIGFTATPSLGMQAGDIATSSIPGSAALVVVDRYNADYSLYNEDTITKASNGNYTFHFQGGSFFNGKSFAAFDNVTNSSGLLLNQTLYNSASQTTQQTQFNANGSVYLQDNVVYPAAGQVLYQYRSGTFFTGKRFSAFDNLATTAGNTLLDQLLYNRDGSHTFTVPGSGLTLTAVKTDTFNVSGQNETTRFNATGFGADTFNGYKSGDIFSFSTSIFANYAALQQHLSGTSSAVITDANNDTLTLANVAKSSVTSSMFKFA